MIVELQRFVEFGDDWHNHEPRRREDMLFERVTINTAYVAWIRKYEIYPGADMQPFDFCEVHMADRGGNFIFDKTYEGMKALVERPAT